MKEQYGTVKTRALEKYQGLTTLTKVEAREIINICWPNAEEASPAEVFKAITLCTQYGLNPLFKHLFLIPFWNKAKGRDDYVCVLGIATPRLIASRKHKWSFLEDTPRIGSEEEILRHFGTADPERVRALVQLRDLDTGAEVTAWGEWAIYKTKDGAKVLNKPKGVDKGNSVVNMACTHAERKGLDMLYPADLPSPDIPVGDEDYIEGVGTVIDEPPESVEETDDTADDRTKEDEAQGGGAGPEVSETKEGEEAPKKSNESAGRDPATVKNFGDLYTSCRKDWPHEFNERSDVWKELGFTCQEDITNLPSVCYATIAAARR